MKKMIWSSGLLALFLFATVACGDAEEEATGANNGQNNGQNNGATNNGDANNGDANNGDANNGDANNGEPDLGGDGADMGADMGDDAGAEPDAVGADMGGQGGACPPQGPFGDAVGSVAPDVEFPDCDGQMHSLHDLCEHQVGWIFEFAAWCPPCRAFLPTVNDLYLSFNREELGAFVIISQDNNFGAPDAAFCQTVKRQYNLTDVTVLYDPDGRLQEALNVRSNDVNILMRRGGEIFFKQQYASSQVRGAIEAELSAQ